MSELSIRLRHEIDNLWANAKLDNLDDICRRALKASRKSDDIEAEAVALLGLAIAHRLRGDAYEAGVLADGARQYASKIYADLLICDTWLEVGAYHRTLRLDYRPSMEAYQQAHATALKIDYRRGLMMALIGLAECHNDYRNFKEAQAMAQEAIALAQTEEEAYHEARAYIALGRAFIGNEQHDDALTMFRQAQELAEEHTYPFIHTLSAYHAGVLFSGFQDMYDQAQTTLNAAHEISVHTQYAYGEFLALYGLSLTHDRHQAYASAREMCDSIAIMAQETGNHAYITAAFLSMGASFHAEGAFESAHKQFTHALREAEQHNLNYLRATAFIWLARNARSMKQFDRAQDDARQAFTAFNAENDAQAARDALGIMVGAILQGWWQRLLRLLGIGQDTTH
jgi:tetratricopeptide (TPR) repeat protein